MASTVPIAPEDELFVLSNLPPSRAQKRGALAVVLFMLFLTVLIMGPLSSVRLNPAPAFLPMYLTATFLNCSFTATLLFAQFAISRTLGNIVIASGYFISAIVVIPYSLTLSGLFAPAGPTGDLQTTAWLFELWHVGFPMFVIAYALLKDPAPGKRIRRGTVPAAITLSLASVAVGVAGVTFLLVAGAKYSPVMTLDNSHFSPLPSYVVAPAVGASLAAIAVLWIRQRSLLDLWLMVVLFLFVVEMPMSYDPNAERFSLGWYAARIIAIFGSSIVLIVLLYEINTIYARLIRTNLALSKERGARLATGDAIAAMVAHEVKQPLSGMITSGDAGLRFLDHAPPDLDEARGAFQQIVADGHRTGDIISSFRAIFKKDAHDRMPMDLNDLIEKTLALARADFAKHRIRLEARLSDRLPSVAGDRIQLQQVLLNLISNAVESMSSVEGPRILSVKSEMYDAGDVRISVADTGIGIDPADAGKIFNPLFSTKTNGMGMGLSICRSIIEAHEGRLWVDANKPCGSVFYFTTAHARVS